MFLQSSSSEFQQKFSSFTFCDYIVENWVVFCIHHPNFQHTWHINWGITRWNELPLKCKFFPDRPINFSPVHKHRKFSAVLGTTSALNSISIRPFGLPPIVISKNTTGFSLLIVKKCADAVLLVSWVGDDYGQVAKNTKPCVCRSPTVHHPFKKRHQRRVGIWDMRYEDLDNNDERWTKNDDTVASTVVRKNAPTSTDDHEKLITVLSDSCRSRTD